MKLLYAGSFNPFHNGHLEVFREAERYGEVHIGIGKNADKQVDKNYVKRCCHAIVPHDRVHVINGLVAEFAKNKGFDAIVRGIRNPLDIEEELKIARYNDGFGIKTIFIPTFQTHLSSSDIRKFIKSTTNLKMIGSVMPVDVFKRYNNTDKLKTIITGKICSGKTTYANNVLHGDCVNVDDAIWKGIKKNKKDKLKLAVQEAVYHRNELMYHDAMVGIFNNFDMSKLKPHIHMENLDFPVYGIWSEVYRELHDLHQNCKIVYVQTEPDVREIFIKKRGLDKETVDFLDEIYVMPKIIDEVVTITMDDLVE